MRKVISCFLCCFFSVMGISAQTLEIQYIDSLGLFNFRDVFFVNEHEESDLI